MLILGLDTATPWGTIALGDETEIFFEISLKSGKGGGEYLLSILNQFCVKSGKDLGEVELIASGTGPGSYTGIRVGLAAVRGLAEGLNVSVIGINTLRIIAENGKGMGDWIMSVIDARRDSVYAALYQNCPTGLKEYWSPFYTDIYGLEHKLTQFSNLMICGDAGKKYRQVWERIPGAKVCSSVWDRPLAANLIQIAFQEWSLKNRMDLMDLRPCYLRRVEAEVRLEERLNADRSCSDETGRY